MKKILYSFIIILCGMLSGIYFAYNRNWIIIQYPYRTKEESFTIEECKSAVKKVVRRIFWNHGKWNNETTDIIWSDDKADTIQHLINSWLILLDEEKLMTKKVLVQSVIMSQSGNDVYISFDRNPFNKASSTYQKMMWIEGLLKTIRDNNIKVQQVQFLVHHQPMHDLHLDFSSPWPIGGFLEASIHKK